MKKLGYKYQIEQELIKQNWEITAVNENIEWWDDEHWKVELQYDSQKTFYLCFIVDPMFEGPRKKGQGVYEIKALSEFPTSWNDDLNIITAISMSKRKFDIKLKEFMDALESHKRQRK